MTTKTEKYESQRAKLLAELEGNAPKLWERFKAWERENVAEKNQNIENLDVNAFMWVKSLDIGLTSRRTYFLRLLGEYAQKYNARVPETPRLQRIKRRLVTDASSHVANRAAHLSAAEVTKIMTNPVLATIFFAAARIGNATGFRTKSLIAGEQGVWHWTLVWFQQKTTHIIGTRQVTLNLLESDCPVVIPFLKGTVGKPSTLTEDQVKKEARHLQEIGMRLHSFRRSSLAYWQKRGLPMQELMAISLHKSPDQLIAYLEGSNEVNEQES